MAKKIIKTKNYSEAAEECQIIADDLATTYHESKNVKSALAAATLYKTAVTLGKALLLSQKQTGKPSGIIGGFQ